MKVEYIDQNKMFLKVENDAGFAVIFCKQGAALYRIDFKGKPMNITFEDKDFYLAEDFTYFGRVVGPMCGRIAKGRYTLNGKVQQLETNEGENSLHSGSASFAFTNFDVEVVEADPIRIIFTKKTKPFQGYPASCDVKITYSIPFNKPTLQCDFDIVADEDVPIKPTAHTYFNLGEDCILNHTLQMNASRIIEMDKDQLPVGEIEMTPVLSFKKEKPIRLDLFDTSIYDSRFRGYDHCAVYDEINPNIPQATLSSTHYTMKIFTDMRGMVYYTYNYTFKNSGAKLGKLIEGIKNNRHAGIALEPQDAFAHIEDNIVKAGTPYRRFYRLEFGEK